MGSSDDFRDHLYDLDHPRLAEIRGMNTRDYREHVRTDSFAGPMITGWSELYPRPFHGVTTDGGPVVDDLFTLAASPAADAAPTAQMCTAAESLLRGLDDDDRDRLTYPLGAHEWRTWANPEFMQHDTGLRLDEVGAEVRIGILGLLAASLAPAGYRLVRDLMRINAFTGELTDLPLILGEYSYNIALYGTPSLDEPWGWHFFGHHVALNCLVVGTQMVVSPVFAGAEPSYVDSGPLAGLRVFDDRITHARELLATLDEHTKAAATTYRSLVDPAMPPGRLHPGDERHLGGCFQDNAVIPLEGVAVADLAAPSRALILAIVDDYLALLPAGPAAARRREIAAHIDETWFSWMGGWGPDDPFYFRIQNPVVVLELDHHCGVFLTNDEPMRFHIHTVMRTPNGNDYGRVLVQQRLGADARLPGDVT